MNSAYLSLSRYQISALTDSFNFLDQISLKKLFLVKNKKSKHHHGILHIRISLIANFQLKLIIFSFD